MVRQFMKNKRGQNTAEYALLIALVVGGVIAMQTYAQRALQARVRDASVFMTKSNPEIGNTLSYEPVATQTNADIRTESIENKRQSRSTIAQDTARARTRVTGARETQTYNTAAVSVNGIVASGL